MTSLTKIDGIQHTTLPIPDLHLITHLDYCDGPLLSHFMDQSGNHYIYHWADFDETCNRWILFRVSGNRLNQYLKRQLSHKNMMMSAVDQTAFIIDLDDTLSPVKIVEIPPSKIPLAYIPSDDLLFEPALSLFGFQGYMSMLAENEKLRQTKAIQVTNRTRQPEISIT